MYKNVYMDDSLINSNVSASVYERSAGASEWRVFNGGMIAQYTTPNDFAYDLDDYEVAEVLYDVDSWGEVAKILSEKGQKEGLEYGIVTEDAEKEFYDAFYDEMMSRTFLYEDDRDVDYPWGVVAFEHWDFIGDPYEAANRIFEELWKKEGLEEVMVEDMDMLIRECERPLYHYYEGYDSLSDEDKRDLFYDIWPIATRPHKIDADNVSDERIEDLCEEGELDEVMERHEMKRIEDDED